MLHDKLSQHIKEWLTFEWRPNVKLEQGTDWGLFFSDLRRNYPNKSIRYAVNTICIMCKRGLIPASVRRPRDAAVTFLWVLCSHLSAGRKMWREIGDGSCSWDFCLRRVHRHRHRRRWPWPCRATVRISRACTRERGGSDKGVLLLLPTGFISHGVNSDIIHGDHTEKEEEEEKCTAMLCGSTSAR